MKARIFDHLDGAPAGRCRHFSRVAHAMRRSEWWRTVPTYQPPVDRAGEIELRMKGANDVG